MVKIEHQLNYKTGKPGNKMNTCQVRYEGGKLIQREHQNLNTHWFVSENVKKVKHCVTKTVN